MEGVKMRMWYACFKCDEVEWYNDYGDSNVDLSPGHFYAHQDDIVVDLKTKDEALEWLEWMRDGRKWPTPNAKQATE